MKTRIPACSSWAFCTAMIFGVVVETHAASPLHPTKSALQKVLELEAQADVVTVDRRDALKPSMNLDSASDADWWQSGFVKTNESWQPVEKLIGGGAEANLDEYRSQRDATPKTAAGQLKLANWCRSNKLADQERAHLIQVLALSEGTADRTPIFKRMGYRQLGENWVSPAEFQDLQKQSRRMARQLLQWQAELDRITRNWGGNARQHKLAQDELNGINCPTAIPSLLTASRISDSLALAICDRLKSIPSFESSQALATIAVQSEWPSVREAATKNLKDRRIDDFAPALLGAMRGLFAPVKPADGTNQPQLVFREEGDRYVAIDVQVVPIFDSWQVQGFRLGFPRRPFIARDFLPNNQIEVRDAEYLLQRQLEEENDRSDEYNQRVGAILGKLTSQETCSNPKYWWAWWHLHTGTEPCPKKCEFYHKKIPLHATPILTISCSCLVAGTSIMTDNGLVAVDAIQVGDRVLSKDVDSGEIAYKPVLHTTVRQPVPVKKFVVGETSIVASAGHHFWVSGQGWSKTRELKSGQPIHTATGMSRVETVEDEGQPASVYNLVVADYHTYFVGPSMILSHDVLQPALTNAKVPGLDTD